MKISSVIFLAVLITTGCKNPETKKAVDDGGNIGQFTVPKERNFSSSELVIGRRICSALKHKRELFESLGNMEQQFRVRGELKKCDSANPYNVSEFLVSISNVSSSNLEYVSNVARPNYFKDVATDLTGVMNSLCDSLSKTDTISNTILNGSSYLIVNLLIAESYDRYEVFKKMKGSNGNYTTVSAEGVAVITQTNQAASKFFGVEKDRILYGACPSSNDTSYVRQTWITATTPF